MTASFAVFYALIAFIVFLVLIWLVSALIDTLSKLLEK